jgi:hypothetical protein
VLDAFHPAVRDPFLPAVRVLVRTGDTPAKERASMSRRPPHILVTTPESLYILLTSDGGRRILRTVRTVIVDEIHAVAGDKRGAHLALSLERLEALAGNVQRIGLSATQKPLDEVGRFPVGAGRECALVDAGHLRPLDEVFDYLHPETARHVLTQALLAAPMFGTRWRWNVSRALLLERMQGGRKVPAPLQRMRAQDLLAGAFPQVLACGENLPGGDIPVPMEHPIVRQTVEDCLTEAMDVDGFLEVLRGIREGRIARVAVDTPEPSAFARGILSAQLETALGELIAHGFLTCDSFGALRGLIVPPSRRRGPMATVGRWGLFRREMAAPPPAEFVARQLLRRTGVVFRRTLAREKQPVPWRDLVRVYRAMEARGEVRGGRFVAGFDGEQYGLPEAVSLLRAVRKRGEVAPATVSAADPLNFRGILTPDERVPPVARRRVQVG